MRTTAVLLILFILAQSVVAASSEIRSSIYPVEDNIVIWNPANFAGFAYDVDNDLGRESLLLNISDEAVDAGSAEYWSQIQSATFKHAEWGEYLLQGFLGQSYFAGYADSCTIADAWNALAEGHFLSQVLIDSDEKITIASDEALTLADGYSLKFSDTEDGVKASLFKGTSLLDLETITPPSDFVYKANLSGFNTTLIAISVQANVKLTPKSYYTIKGIFQISENTMPLEPGSRYGMFQIDDISMDGLKLQNDQRLDLARNLDMELLNGIRIKTSDANAAMNRIYLDKNISGTGSYDIRSEIATGTGFFAWTWTPMNFAGFYYDAIHDIGTETLSTFITEGVRLSGDYPYGIQYITKAQSKEFEFSDWGSFSVLGFLGDPYFVGYLEGSPIRSEHYNLLADEKLAKILIDSGELHSIQDGESLQLAEGLDVKLFGDKDCNKTLIELYKDGELIDRDYMDVPGTYTYEVQMGSLAKFPVLGLHVSEINCTAGKKCIVDGIFQISQNPIDVEADTCFGKLCIAVVDASNGVLEMVNRDNPITLSRNVDIPLVENISIKTADSSDLRYVLHETIDS